ncbi:MAG TPA: hypothetical protein VIW02_00530, partial [Gammaproteobacteria bacterium]
MGRRTKGRRLYSSARAAAGLFALLAGLAGCAVQPPASPPELDDALAAAGTLQQERRPLSALALLERLTPPADPLLLGRLRLARVSALFDAERFEAAAAECAALARELPDDPGWRPACWEVRIEGAADRAAASAAVTAEIES